MPSHTRLRYDLLIDDNLKPWLVEVNASPSLSASTKADRIMKQSLLRDVYRVVAPKKGESWESWRGAVHSGPCRDEGGFKVPPTCVCARVYGEC